MDKNNSDDYEPVSDAQGRLRDLPSGRFIDDESAEGILRNAKVKDCSSHEEIEPPKPYFVDNLIEQYNFFRENISKPQRVFYPCCGLDVSPIRGFPNSEVVLMDNERCLEEIMKQEGIREFTLRDVQDFNPETAFDLVIILNPCLSSGELTRHLSKGGYVLANNYHNNAFQLLDDSGFKGLGTIDKNERGIYLAKGDFSKIEPNQFATYLYVFRKK